MLIPQSQLSKIKTLLGKPYYEQENCLIYNTDCLEGLRKIKEPMFRLTVTSPPYNIGKEYESKLSLEEYLNWCQKWINRVYMISTNDASFWLNLGYLSIPNQAKAIPIPYLIWNRVPFFLMQEVVWHYGAGVAAKKFLSPRNEKFLWYVKNAEEYTFNLDEIRDPNVKYPNQKKNGKIKVNALGKNPTDVWIFPKVTSGNKRSSKERTNHPAQFPTAVIERIIKGCSNSGDLILDPFMGSGTTAEVALNLGRLVVGFEINKDYCDITSRRLSKNLRMQSPGRIQSDLSLTT